jgi:DUF1009 family protein
MRGEPLGLIAGSGRFPLLFAQAARAQGHPVHAVAHEDETDPALEALVDSLEWVKVGQANAILAALKKHGVSKAVLAGGIGRVRSLTKARPDLGMLQIAASVRSMRDDELLRAVAAFFEKRGVKIVAPTDYLATVLAPEGHLAGPPLSEGQQRDVELGLSVAKALGEADVGQTVVVKEGVVLAVEAVEGTDEALRRAGKYGGKGAVVVKRFKPGQDARFDLPAAGPVTLEVMREIGAQVLAVEAGRTVLLDAAVMLKWAERLKIAVVGVR